MDPASQSHSHSLAVCEAAVASLPDGILWAKREGTIIYANDATAKILGAPLKALPGSSFPAHVHDPTFPSWFLAVTEQTSPEPFRIPTGWIHVLTSRVINDERCYCFRLTRPSDTPGSSSEMLRIISEGTAPMVGGDFFKSLAYHVILSTGIRYAIITECANAAKTRVRTLVYIERDHFLDNFEYDLSGTPCELVMEGENYYCTADLDSFFPRDTGVKSYFGVPIFLSTGEVIGHMAIFDTKPISLSLEKLNILKIFASRAGAEIERKNKEELLESSIVRYQGLFQDSPIGLCEEDFSEVKKHIEQLKKEYRKPLSKIFETHPAEITVAYQKIKHLTANKSQLQLFGLHSEQEYSDYLTQQPTPPYFRELVLSFDEGRTCFEREIEITTANGRKRTLFFKRILLPGSKYHWSQSLASAVDVTDQKQAEAQLRSALDEVKGLKERLEAENTYLQQEIKLDHNFEEIVSKSAQFRKVLEKIEQVADTDATVLILGESGTGKELIARGIHSISRRSQRPLVKVNCAALPSNLIESELFGHEKGAFTGALSQKIGRFELADGGTLFLDEVGEMPLEVQSKLLRVLQEGEFERVGGTKTVRVDVRIIAATNRDLDVSVSHKEFRADLFYRLNVFPISTPPLRERKEDIPLLVNHFAKKHGARFGKKITTISKQVLDALMNYDWPGNVRELENIMERGLIIATRDTLEMGDWLPKPVPPPPMPTPSPSSGADRKSMEAVERAHILDVLQRTNWKIRGENGAAKILALNPTTLEARMKKLGIRRV